MGLNCQFEKIIFTARWKSFKLGVDFTKMGISEKLQLASYAAYTSTYFPFTIPSKKQRICFSE